MGLCNLSSSNDDTRIMKTDELREKYLAFYETKGHRRCASDVLVPTWDPSVLFTPAGMNQFKDHFLGKVKLEFTRATTCQKCLRTGDIDNVGRTAYHHTFFEMLGNFSFGDYFKREAIGWAWEFLTDKQWLGIDPQRLSVTIYKDDQEAGQIWADDIGLPSTRIEPMEEDENFWPASAPSQGPDGVCGPCSEIYYLDNNGQQVEIWNLVFTQFNRVGDPPNNLRPLPSKNIDTGMGLERTAAALQGVPTNYHIDTLLPIVQTAAEVCGIEYQLESENGRRLRRITDHVRACTFAVHENVYPGANKEKYVVKRLLRRAVLDGHQLGLHQPFLHQLVPAVVDAMKSAYPELTETLPRVQGVIQQEEANFFATIDDGLNRIERVFDEMRDQGRVRVNGAAAADLYQTYGVPPELFEALAAEHNLTFDWDGYASSMAEHGKTSGKTQHTVMGNRGPIDSLKHALHSSEFLGYETLSANATIKGIIAGQPPHDQLCDTMDELIHEEATEAIPVRVVLDRTPFYGESGGQVGDTGVLRSGDDADVSGDDFGFEVTDTQRDGSLIIHYGHLRHGVMREGAPVCASVDTSRRDGIRRAHSATHILHHALQKNLGSHAQQQGSKVDQDWLRFDFTNLQAVEPPQLAQVNQHVSARIEAGEDIAAQVLPLATARAQGAMMLFGEKYPDPVRMVTMGSTASGPFSKELCGGTHLDNTASIGGFEILHEEGIAAGTRRITALTGPRAAEYILQIGQSLTTTATALGCAVGAVPEAVMQLLSEQRDLKKLLASGATPTVASSVASSANSQDHAHSGDAEELSPDRGKQILNETAKLLSVAMPAVPDRIKALQDEISHLQQRLDQRSASGPLTADHLLEMAHTIEGVTLIVAEAPTAESNLMRQLIDQIRQKASPCAVLLASTEGTTKVTLVAGLSQDLQARGGHAGNWIRPVAQALGGGGGGRADMAQAGGKNPEKLPEALEIARQTIAQMLQ
jgi:alanyl-tRNA synthetase